VGLFYCCSVFTGRINTPHGRRQATSSDTAASRGAMQISSIDHLQHVKYFTNCAEFITNLQKNVLDCDQSNYSIAVKMARKRQRAD